MCRRLKSTAEVNRVLQSVGADSRRSSVAGPRRSAFMPGPSGDPAGEAGLEAAPVSHNWFADDDALHLHSSDAWQAAHDMLAILCNRCYAVASPKWLPDDACLTGPLQRTMSAARHARMSGVTIANSVAAASPAMEDGASHVSFATDVTDEGMPGGPALQALLLSSTC